MRVPGSAALLCLAASAAASSAQPRAWSPADCHILDVRAPPETARRCAAAVRAGQLSRDDLGNAYIYGGDEQLRRGDVPRAVANYSRALQVRPRHAETHYRRGNAHYLGRDYRRALADYQAALRPNPDYHGYLIGRGNARYMLHDYAGALADYSRAIEINPYDSAGRVGRGNVYVVWHDPVRALADFDLALQRPSTDPYAYLARAAARMEQRDWEGALEDLNRSLDLNPNDAMAMARRARVHVARGRRAWADADFAAAERLAQGDAPALNSLCWNLMMADVPLDRARRHCDAALAVDPNDIDALHSRGLISLRQGDVRGALADLERALRRDRDNPELVYGRGLARLQLGRTRDGRADIARALRLNPRIAQVYVDQYGVTPVR